MLESSVEFLAMATRSLSEPGRQNFLALLLGGAGALLVSFWAAGRLLRPGFAWRAEAAPTEAERAGVTAASREAIEAALRAEGLVAPELDGRLAQAVDALARLRTRLAETSPPALEAVDRGDFAEARAILREGAGLSRGEADRAQVEFDAKRFAAAGVIDEIKLDFRGAAENFDAAATLVAKIGEEAAAEREWRLRMEQARALVADATVKGARDSIAPAIAVCDKALSLAPRARAPHAWAQTQLQRGDALLAAEEPHLVEDAVHSYRAALEEWTQRSAPFEWARAQHNLGEALKILAEQDDGGVERLRPAADAYRAALRAWTRETAPDLWALAQGNLGDVLAMIGARTGDVIKLREAVAAYQAALGELRRDIAPREWAQLQDSLGVALEALAEQECREGEYGGPLTLAVEAFQSALEERSAENEPAQYAATSVSLGDSLLALGEHESKANPDYGGGLLGRAADSYRNALKAREALAPDDVARIEINLAYALGLIWTRRRDEALLDEALAHVEDAAALLREGGDPQHLRAAEAARANLIEARLTQAA
ncbi:hypothetical protein [Methylocella sp.]|uniref:hypothetical protein n=1 Tax=Methylocella sp. TaxID=1978226 RepID=UPI003784AB1F